MVAAKKLLLSIQHLYSNVAAIVKLIWNSLRLLVVPFTVSVAAYIIFSTPDQVLDIYPSIVDEAKMSAGVGGALHVAFLFIFYLAFSYLLYRSVAQKLGGRHDAEGDDALRDKLTIDRLSASVLNALPTYGIAVGFSKAYGSTSLTTTAKVWSWAVISLLLLAFVAAAYSLYRRFATNKAAIAPGERSGLALFICVSLFIISVEMCIQSNVYAPRLFGPLAIVTLFLIGLLLISASISLFDKKIGKAIAVIAACSFAISNYYDVNDNHEMRWFYLNVADAYKPGGLEQNFVLWLTSRQDLVTFQKAGKPYPVFVASAEGGGLYAGLNAALFFARMQDICPNFSQHLFAISSVSGGSLGAAVFSGLASGMASNKTSTKCTDTNGHAGRYEILVRRYFSDDFLSPLVFGFLFPDFIQRFLPWPIKSFDRARDLELSFDQSWRALGLVNPDYLSKGMTAQWSPWDSTPALLMNTTVVSTGEQVIISPWRDLALDGVFAIDHFTEPLVDYPVYSAVSASARFPYVTPAARLPQAEMNRGETSFIRLADGGFFENSGAETAAALVKSLNLLQSSSVDEIADQLSELAQMNLEIDGHQASEKDIRQEALYLASTFKETRFQIFSVSVISEGRFLGYTERSGWSEYLSPFDTLMNTRQARGFRAEITLQDTICLTCRFAGLSVYDERSHRVLMSSTDYKLPLGWVLSARTQDYIASQAPTKANCELESKNKEEEYGASIRRTNRCVFEAMKRRLDPLVIREEFPIY